VTVAAELVGCRLVVDAGGDDAVVARLVEVEAYLGEDDPASHAHRGPTPRAAIMFGPAGHLYVYFSYGMHHCANLVTEAAGTAGAVLLRSAEVVTGEAVVRRRRVEGRGPAATPPAAVGLLRGPGNLCRGLGLDLADNGLDACAPGGRLRVLAADVSPEVVRVPRVGISRAAELPLRFVWRGHPAVSSLRRVPAG
jgi:DNA-3-methyladenine glycosylase